MKIIIFLLVIEGLTWLALFQHFYKKSSNTFYIPAFVNLILSIWLWVVFIAVYHNKSDFATSRYTWMLMNLIGLACAIVIPLSDSESHHS
jgi:hypothetical protein